jgi:surfactin synthase thioesterase subunit
MDTLFAFLLGAACAFAIARVIRRRAVLRAVTLTRVGSIPPAEAGPRRD